VNENQIFLQLTVNETQVVLQSLGKMPFETVADLWFKIKATAEQQVSAQQVQNAGAGAAATDIGAGGTE